MPAVPDETVETPALHGLVGDDSLVPLAHRKDLRVRAFPVRHSVPSLGYTILAHKRKLKPEYKDTPGPEIARLRKQGVDVQYDVDDPLLTFIGDCDGATLLEQQHIWASPVLILEATFLEPGEEELARKKAHTHLTEIAAALETMKYPRDQVLALVAGGIPARFQDRVRVLL